MRKLLKASKGFTLIELMIVIAIIAILAAILIPNFIRARGQSQLAACESNEKNIATSMEMYSTDSNGNYPLTATGLTTALVPTYMRVIPTCPSNAAAYTYVASSTSVPVTDYAIAQGGTDPHTSFMTNKFTLTPPSWDSNCVKGAAPCYLGSQGLVTGN